MAKPTTETKKRMHRTFEGTVVDSKMNKTIVVETYRLGKHTRYGKYMKTSSSFKVHDGKGQAKIGDKVQIMETRPLSKTKFFKLFKVLEKAQ